MQHQKQKTNHLAGEPSKQQKQMEVESWEEVPRLNWDLIITFQNKWLHFSFNLLSVLHYIKNDLFFLLIKVIHIILYKFLTFKK